MINGTNEQTINAEALKSIIQHYFDTVVYAEGQSPVIEEIYSQPRKSLASNGTDQWKPLGELKVKTIDRKQAFKDSLKTGDQ